MLPKEGLKGQRRIYSLLCSLEEKEKGQEDENSCIGRGELGRMLLPWREASSLGLNYLMVITSLLGGGRTIGVDAQLPGNSFAWRKPILTGSMERQHKRAHSCGGIASLGQRGRRTLHFSGESNKGEGAHEFGCISHWILLQGL
jgi:hypothetical protein